jgi:GR25 family glycosyltransferase involved in LPS biosynthesis
MIHHYIISGWTPNKTMGVDDSRKEFLFDQFKQYNLNEKDITWMEGNNKDDLTDDFIKSIYVHNKEIDENTLKKGRISCTYKHYLSLKDIVEKDRPYAAILEDDVSFNQDIQLTIQKIIEDANKYYPDWDIIFDGDINHSWGPCAYYYDEEKVSSGKLVYKKNNLIREHMNSYIINYPHLLNPTRGIIHGATRGANYYIVNQKSAKLLLENFLPFDNIIDHYYNVMIRKLNLNVYWSEPPFVHKMRRKSTLIHDD